MIHVSPPARNRFGSLPQLSPPSFACLRDGVELPDQLAGFGVVGADEALLLLVFRAATQALHDLALDDDGAAAGAVLALAAIADHGVPDILAGARIERVDVRVAGGDINLVVVDREPALRAAGRRRADAVLPDQLARARVQRLHDVAGIVDEHDAVMHHGRGLIGPFIHGPYPLELQILHVLRGDLIQRAVIVGVIVVADHQPVAGIGIAQHGVGDRREVFHFAGAPSDLAALPEPALRRVRPAVRPAGRGCRFSRLCSPSGGDRTDGNFARCRERLVARARAVEFQNESRDIDIRLLAQAARISRRHGAFEKRNQVARACGRPNCSEESAC